MPPKYAKRIQNDVVSQWTRLSFFCLHRWTYPLKAKHNSDGRILFNVLEVVDKVLEELLQAIVDTDPSMLNVCHVHKELVEVALHFLQFFLRYVRSPSYEYYQSSEELVHLSHRLVEVCRRVVGCRKVYSLITCDREPGFYSSSGMCSLQIFSWFDSVLFFCIWLSSDSSSNAILHYFLFLFKQRGEQQLAHLWFISISTMILRDVEYSRAAKVDNWGGVQPHYVKDYTTLYPPKLGNLQ